MKAHINKANDFDDFSTSILIDALETFISSDLSDTSDSIKLQAHSFAISSKEKLSNHNFMLSNKERVSVLSALYNKQIHLNHIFNSLSEEQQEDTLVHLSEIDNLIKLFE